MKRGEAARLAWSPAEMRRGRRGCVRLVLLTLEDCRPSVSYFPTGSRVYTLPGPGEWKARAKEREGRSKEARAVG